MNRIPTMSSFALLLALAAFPAAAQQTGEDSRPLSPAQRALFMTPHLKNVSQPETLQYEFTRTGKGGFDDTVLEHIKAIHPDGTKLVSFDYLSGDHRKPFPEIDDFAGNPLLMLFLETDVQNMRDTLRVSATYFRNHVREAMVDHATCKDVTYAYDGKALPAVEVTVQPFADDERLEHLPSVQAKTYRFVISDSVPGGIAEMQTSMPADPQRDIIASGEKLTFAKVAP